MEDRKWEDKSWIKWSTSNSEQEHANDEEVTHENQEKDETEKIKQVKVIKVGGMKEQIPSSKIEIEETKALEIQDLPREEGRGKR